MIVLACVTLATLAFVPPDSGCHFQFMVSFAGDEGAEARQLGQWRCRNLGSGALGTEVPPRPMAAPTALACGSWSNGKERQSSAPHAAQHCSTVAHVFPPTPFNKCRPRSHCTSAKAGQTMAPGTPGKNYSVQSTVPISSDRRVADELVNWL